MKTKTNLVKIFHHLLKPLKKIEAFKVLSVVTTIDLLEKNNEFDEANKIRGHWLSVVKFKNSSPLWLSLGNYQFTYLKNYEEALVSFEKAAEAFKLQPLHYSKVNPLDIYYGCAVSAVMLGQTKKGEEYLKEVKKYYKAIDTGHNLSDYAKFNLERIKWLEEQLMEENRGRP